MAIYHRSLEEQQSDIVQLAGESGVTILEIGGSRSKARWYTAIDDEWSERVLSAGVWSVRIQHDRRTAWAINHRVDGEFMHRWIFGPIESDVVDHKNGNGLDNRLTNLRSATLSQNAMNRRKSPGQSSQFKGVWFDGKQGLWVSHIKPPGRSHQRILGRFKTEQAAAWAYDEAARVAFGEFAMVNGVDGPGEEVGRRPKQEYSPVLRQQVVTRAIEMGNVSAAARELGVELPAAHHWVRQWKRGRSMW